jgi:hypothetical protein
MIDGMSQAEARTWWADVEHLREAAERRQADEARRRAADERARARRENGTQLTPALSRSRSRAATRVQEAAGGAVDELTARRAVALDERTPRPRRPVPIWLADDAMADPIARARARAAAPRRTVEIRGQVAGPPEWVHDAARRAESLPTVRRHSPPSLGSSFATHPDRVAFWAFALGIVLVMVAAMSAHPA